MLSPAKSRLSLVAAGLTGLALLAGLNADDKKQDVATTTPAKTEAKLAPAVQPKPLRNYPKT